MKIIIDIPENTYKFFIEDSIKTTEILEAVRHGTRYNGIDIEMIWEFIQEFDNEHPALFSDYMQEFNNHTISEIIDYMWDMHCLIEDIKYRLPKEGEENE